MFIQSCFIDGNTKDVRKVLEDLGYIITPRLQKELPSYGIMCDSCSSVAMSILKEHYPEDYFKEKFFRYHSGVINCKNNKDLFFALAALRYDSDKFQWFTDGINWAFCDSNKFGSYWVRNDAKLNLDTIHKATTQELIEHFKEK